jgi:hypothetical protein
MGRAIGAVIGGYLVMAIAVFATMSAAYKILGPDGSLRPGTYEPSAGWLITSIIIGVLAAVLGGFVCAAIARSSGPPKVLAGVVVILGLLYALPLLTGSGEQAATVSEGQVGNVEVTRQARQPLWVALLNPLIGAAGVLAGARLRAGRETGIASQDSPAA